MQFLKQQLSAIRSRLSTGGFGVAAGRREGGNRIPANKLRLTSSAIIILFTGFLLIAPVFPVYAQNVFPRIGEPGNDISGAINGIQEPTQVAINCTSSLTEPFNALQVPCVFKSLAWLLAWLSAVLVGWMGMAMDFALRYTVFQNPISQMYAGVVVSWTIVRDFSNLFFIFIMVYIGIMTMVGQGSFGTRQLLAKVIVVALLINFSFFITSFIIDLSNVVAFQIRSTIAPPDQYISMSMTGAMRVEYNYQGIDPAENLTPWKGALVYLARFVVNMIAFWVFFQALILIAVRLVVFVFLIVFSPAAFLCSILPGTSKYYSQWKQHLIDQALVAPVFLFLVLIITTVLKTNFNTDASANFANKAVVDLASPVIFIYVLSGLMFIFALRITKKLSGDVGKSALTIGNTVAGLAVAGGIGFAARQTLGRAALAVSNSEGVKDAMAKGGARGWVATKVWRGSEKTAKSSMDFRDAPGAKKLGLGDWNKQKGGYNQTRKNNDKYYKENLEHAAKSKVQASDLDGFNQSQHIGEAMNEERKLDSQYKNLTSGSADVLAAKAMAQSEEDGLITLRSTHSGELAAKEGEFKSIEERYTALTTGKKEAVDLADKKKAALGRIAGLRSQQALAGPGTPEAEALKTQIQDEEAGIGRIQAAYNDAIKPGHEAQAVRELMNEKREDITKLKAAQSSAVAEKQEKLRAAKEESNRISEEAKNGAEAKGVAAKLKAQKDRVKQLSEMDAHKLAQDMALQRGKERGGSMAQSMLRQNAPGGTLLSDAERATFLKQSQAKVDSAQAILEQNERTFAPDSINVLDAKRRVESAKRMHTNYERMDRQALSKAAGGGRDVQHVLGWAPSGYSVANDYIRTQGKDKQTRLLDELKGEFKKDNDAPLAAPSTPATPTP